MKVVGPSERTPIYIQKKVPILNCCLTPDEEALGPLEKDMSLSE
jgi:hypothetical protein